MESGGGDTHTQSDSSENVTHARGMERELQGSDGRETVRGSRESRGWG